MQAAVWTMYEEEAERAKITTERQRLFMDRAIRAASKSGMTHKHGCVIVIDDEIISEGYNHFFTKMCHKYSIHAEVDALNKARKKTRSKNVLADAELYVVRVGRDGCLKYSKPCEDCQCAIEKMGVKRIFYSCFAQGAHPSDTSNSNSK